VNSRPGDQQVDNLGNPTAECAFVRENIEGFALDALDRFERGMVEHHLRWCDACRAEAVAFEQVVDRLPYTVPLVDEPGADLKADLFARIASTKQVSPAAPRARIAGPGRRDPAHHQAPGWWRFVPAALIAPLALTLLVMGVWANSMRTDLNERDLDEASQMALDEALANGGQVALYSVEKEASCPTCHGSGQLGMSESNEMGMVLGWNFDPDKRHDVWGVSHDGERMKMCELEVDPTGAVMQMFTFPNGPEAFTEVYITDEHGAMTYISHLTQGDRATPEGTRPGSPTA
jgi:hypothetical protein